jgi:metal-sensitive transcriptional repressor
MVDDDRNCIDVLTQISAVRAALDKSYASRPANERPSYPYATCTALSVAIGCSPVR